MISTELQTGRPGSTSTSGPVSSCKPGDVSELRGALERLCGDPEVARPVRRRRQRKRVIEMFTAETMCRATVSLYQTTSVGASGRLASVADRCRRIGMIAKRALDVVLSGMARRLGAAVGADRRR